MSFDILTTTVSADVATNGTITFSYPNGTDAGRYLNTFGHLLSVSKHQTVYDFGKGDFTISFGASNITVTYKGTTTIPAGSVVKLQADRQGANDRSIVFPAKVVDAQIGAAVLVTLGAPVAGAATAVAAAQAVAGANNLTINGTLAVNGAVTFDNPRAVNAVSANIGDTTQTLTVTGKDVYGVTMTETITLNGTTTVTGKKAFKSVSQVKASAATTGNISVGSSNVLGIPVYLPDVAYVLKEIQDSAAAVAGTIVKADTTKASSITGDVRGTYLPNATPNGSIVFRLVAFVADPQWLGNPQA